MRMSVEKELREESRGEKGIRLRCVCVCVRERRSVCMSVLEELREESREEKRIR